MPLRKSHHRPGETLVEVLTAFFILSLTATSSVNLTIQSYKTSAVYKRNFQARYSAREAIEYVHMIVNTNSMRFADPECWDTELKEKKCTKSSLKPLAQTGGSDRKMALVTYKPEDMNFRLVDAKEQQGTDGLQACVNGTATNSIYAIYQKIPSLVDADGKSLDPYGNVLYGTDGTAPANQSPVFCRRITLSKTDNQNELSIKVEILSKDMKQAKIFQEFINNNAS